MILRQHYYKCLDSLSCGLSGVSHSLEKRIHIKTEFKVWLSLCADSV